MTIASVNAFIVARDSEAEAREVVEEIIAKADREAVEGFLPIVRELEAELGVEAPLELAAPVA
jgi:alkanesulfonate monooxygenase SsuD/methylene tetrahydromethanopterin reductase-like flavin-dependent oxidoreductase (luciferase family)